MQGGQPVTYASQALTSTEQQCAQIEKELLSVIFGLARFDTCTFGRQVRIQTDREPLEAYHKNRYTPFSKECNECFYACSVMM